MVSFASGQRGLTLINFDFTIGYHNGFVLLPQVICWVGVGRFEPLPLPLPVRCSFPSSQNVKRQALCDNAPKKEQITTSLFMHEHVKILFLTKSISHLVYKHIYVFIKNYSKSPR